jgi:cytochrome P450
MRIPDGLGDPEVLDQPYSYYARLRDESPVFFSNAVKAFVVTRNADVQEMLRRADVFRSVPLAGGADGGNYNFSPEYDHLYEDAGVPKQMATLVISEGEAHQRYRSLVGAHFSPSAVKHLAQNVDRICNRLIDVFIDKGEADLYGEFCQQLPLFVMCDLLGWPHDKVDLLQRSADALNRLTIGAFETPEKRTLLHRHQVEFHQYALTQMERVRHDPDGSVLSHMLHTMPTDGRPIDEAEFCAMASILNIGGNETTVNGLGSMLFMLVSTPGCEQTLRDDPALIPKFIEEALRIETPVPFVFRWLYEDAELAGVRIPVGSTVMASLGSGNRDEHAYDDPLTVKTDRKGIRNHLSFGSGVHYCLGAMLARLELQTALSVMLTRLRNIARQPVELRREAKITVRALQALPITFERGVPLGSSMP